MPGACWGGQTNPIPHQFSHGPTRVQLRLTGRWCNTYLLRTNLITRLLQMITVSSIVP